MRDTQILYKEARFARLGTEKFMLDGLHTGNGGGDHVTLGGSTLAGRVLRIFLAQVERVLRRQCPGGGARVARADLD